MIRVATVFSGIGAAEQAIKQLGYKSNIVFACDNGERYLKDKEGRLLEKNDIDEIIEANKESSKTVEDIVNELYENTGKPNNVKKSYFANYEVDEERWYEDIRFVDGTPYKNSVDLFIGGSPCQSFSTYGHKLGLEDTRGTLFYDYARLVKEIQPKAFIFENVPGLMTHDKKRTWKVIKEVFEDLDYVINDDVLNAQDYDLPQLRRRLFIVGIRKDIAYEKNITKFKFPDVKELTHKSTDYLIDNIDNRYYLGEKGFNFVTKVERNGRRARVNQDIIGCQTANQQFNWVGDFRVERPEKRHYEDPRIFIGEYQGEPAVARKMVPRELLRLMGFSDDFKIVVDDNVIWRQTGNSIAVPVIKAIIEELVKQLDLDVD